MNIVAPRIRAAITRSGKTQKEIAAELTISETYLSDICNGRRAVSAFVAVRLEAVLGIDAHKLVIDQSLGELREARESAMGSRKARRCRE
jgi:plasmid maintenance system antidote protein VapI